MTETKTESFSIQETAKLTNLSIDTIRYYEKSGLLFPIKRKDNGHREFTEGDVNWINFIVCLKSTGMRVSDIAQYKKLVDFGDETCEKRREIMINHRKKIIENIKELKKSLEKIDYKIEYYDKLLPN